MTLLHLIQDPVVLYSVCATQFPPSWEHTDTHTRMLLCVTHNWRVWSVWEWWRSTKIKWTLISTSVALHKRTRKKEEIKMFGEREGSERAVCVLQRSLPTLNRDLGRSRACVRALCVFAGKERAGPALSLSPCTPLFVYFQQQLSGNLSAGLERSWWIYCISPRSAGSLLDLTRLCGAIQGFKSGQILRVQVWSFW